MATTSPYDLCDKQIDSSTLLSVVERYQPDHSVSKDGTAHPESIVTSMNYGFTLVLVNGKLNQLVYVEPVNWQSGQPRKQGIMNNMVSFHTHDGEHLTSPDDLECGVTMSGEPVPGSLFPVKDLRRYNPSDRFEILLFDFYKKHIIEHFKRVCVMVNCRLEPVTVSSPQPIVSTSTMVPLYKIDSDGSMTIFLYSFQ